MERLSLIVLVIHSTIIGFSLLGVILSGVNYGMNKYDYGVLTQESLVKPDKPPPYSSNETEQQREHRYNLSRINTEYTNKMNELIIYDYDPIKFSLPSFLMTLLISTYFFIVKICTGDVYKSSAVLNSAILIWFVHLYYFLSYVNRRYIPEHLQTYYRAAYPGNVSLHCIMLILIIAWILACGRYLKVNDVKCPTCNGLSIFTLDAILSITRFVASIIGADLCENYIGYGTYMDPCYEFCLRTPISPWFFYTIISLCLLSVVFAGEHLLSLIWGHIHRANSSVGAGFSGLSVAVVCIIAQFTNNRLPRLAYDFMVGVVAVELFHAWNIWANWSFISSPPTILQLVCGKKKPKVSTHVEDVRVRTIGEDDEQNGAADEEIGRVDESIAPVNTLSSALDRSRCLLVNVFTIILCIAAAFIEDISIEMMGLHDNLYHMEVLLIAVLSSCLIKSITAVVTVISYGAPPPKNTLQMIFELLFESIVLLVGISGAYHVPGKIFPKITASLAIAVLLLKIVDVLKANPIKHILILVANEEAKKSPTTNSNVPSNLQENHPEPNDVLQNTPTSTNTVSTNEINLENSTVNEQNRELITDNFVNV